MSTDIERLDEANACHDDDPPRGAALLRQIDPTQLPLERRGNYGALLNHVLGEKLGAWDEALRRQQQLIQLTPDSPPLAVWRHLGSAAWVLGANEPVQRATLAICETSGASQERTHELLALAAAVNVVPGQPVADAAQTALDALTPFTRDSAWPTESALDAQAAGCLSNLVNSLTEQMERERLHGGLRAALARSAEQAQRLWEHAGTWVHQERACYTRAVASTLLGEPHMAYRHSLEGLAVLDEHDGAHTQAVDRAFLELERWNACAWLGLVDEAQRALSYAEALAAQFNDADLTGEFEHRRQRLPGFRR